MTTYNGKKCRQCTNRDKEEYEGMAWCRIWKHDVWLESVACCQFDDTEVF